ncbi:MAG TPA: hypothetical protein VLQ45_23680 [Thermoanaerobaculia bacterium]|nr:hypothetical protein [Thermoanaerobaculia bacterium]
MPEENAHLPLTITPEELEKAEIAVLLDFLRENAARHHVSELREQALAVGYRASVVDRAVADFDEELQSFLETGLEPAPEPPPVRVEERPRPAVSPVPAPPPPKVPAFLERLAEAEQAAKVELSRSRRRTVSAGITLLVVAVNAAILSLAFTGKADLAILTYSAEIALALLLARLQKTLYWQPAEELQAEGVASSVPLASPVRSEPGRTPVPAIAHEVRTETPPAQNVPQRMPSHH